MSRLAALLRREREPCAERAGPRAECQASERHSVHGRLAPAEPPYGSLWQQGSRAEQLLL